MATREFDEVELEPRGHPQDGCFMQMMAICAFDIFLFPGHAATMIFLRRHFEGKLQAEAPKVIERGRQ
jgi:hypothetical protein